MQENRGAVPLSEGTPTSLLRDLWRLLNSFKFAITLLSLVAVISFVGVLIPQNLDPEAYARTFGGAGRLVRMLGLSDVFHTSWYVALLAFLACDIFICIARRSLFLVRSSAKGSSVWIRKLGSVIAHLSIILILVGGMISGLGGFRAQMKVSPGETIPVAETGVTLRLNEFRIETNEEGAVRQYRSRVLLTEPDGRTTSHDILVNHPLSFEGVNVYQNSYGREPREIVTASLAIKHLNENEETARIQVPFGHKIKVDNTSFSVLVSDFVGDFVMDTQSGKVESRSLEHRNPAVYVELFDRKDRPIFSGWSFLRIGGMHTEESQFDVTLLDYEPELYSVLEVAGSPGIPLVYAGFAAAAIGLIVSVSFGQNRRRTAEALEEKRT